MIKIMTICCIDFYEKTGKLILFFIEVKFTISVLIVGYLEYSSRGKTYI